MAKRIELRVDVTEAAGIGRKVELAATAFLPDCDPVKPRQVVIFAVPGGGYSRAYFYLNFEGYLDYSEADCHVSRGLIYVAIDHIGVGENTIPDLSRITFQTFAATYNSCVSQISGLLLAGQLADGFPACIDLFKVGMGQSMGGGVTILTQGRFQTFEAIAPCGVSAIHTALPQRTKEEFELGKNRFDGVATGGVRSHDTMTHEGIDYTYPFHWEDVPNDILQKDMEGGYPIRRHAPEFGSLTIPHCAVQMMTPGCFAADARRIAVPVLIANGERDTCPDPHAEPSAYTGSNDVSIFIVPKMAHMYNFASSRALLWRRLHQWAQSLTSEE